MPVLWLLSKSWEISRCDGIYTYDHRFEDEDGAPLWELLISALKELYPHHVRYFE